MAKEFYGFFDSIAGDEREYDSNDFSQLLRAAMKNGISSHSEEGLKVSCDGVSLGTTISPGGCVIDGYVYVLSDDGGEKLCFEHVPAVGSVRWDRIVARLDKAVDSRKISLKLLTGMPGEDVPELTRNESTYEISLARVRIRPEADVLLEEDIVDERGDESVCGYAVPVWMEKMLDAASPVPMDDESIDGILNE